jgi:hypothetical protein
MNEKRGEEKKMIAALEFLGMRKLIEVQASITKYKVALPAMQGQYVTLVFTPEANTLYGLKGQPKLIFLFNHVEVGE